MEPQQPIKVWVSAKFRDADGNELQLDAEQVAVTNGDDLVQLVQATREQMNDVIPADYDRAVVSKFISTSVDKFFVRIRTSKLMGEKCEENALCRVELLRPGDSDQQFYTLALRLADDTARPKRRHPTSQAQPDQSHRADSSKKAKMEPEEAAEAVNELDEHDLSSLMTKIEEAEPNKTREDQPGVALEVPSADESGSTVGDDFGQEENPGAEPNSNDSLPLDARQVVDVDSSIDGDVDPEGGEILHAECQLVVAAPPVETKLSLQKLREAAKKIRVRSLRRYRRYGCRPKNHFRVTCPVCEDSFPVQADYADGVKHLIEAHLENYCQYFAYKCCIGSCAFGTFDVRLMSTHLRKVHKLTRKAARPTDACYNQSGRLLFLELLDLVKNQKK
ncbi:hypothetical protein AAVH_11845 [Aphelenchoides avenae]|nr:hypothetical protein AAVH_11845 [Aphelenchus avenae]